MKVNKASETCNEFNKANEAAIASGLMENWEPNEQILAEEKREEERKKAGFVFAQTKLEIFKKLDPNTDGETVHGVKVRIEAVTSRGSWHHEGRAIGFRLHFGCRYDDNKKWVGIGDGAKLGINTKQLAKAVATLAEVKAVEDRKNATRNAQQNDEQRTKAFITANPEFCKLVGEYYYCSGETYHSPSGPRYTKAFICLPDGSVKIGFETFTVEQWTEIMNLRAAQQLAMDTLKKSFAQTTLPTA